MLRNIVLSLLLTIAVVIAYWPVFSAGFVWDDDDYVTHNRALIDLEGLSYIWTPTFLLIDDGAAFQRDLVTPQYYPVTFTSFWIEHQLWGDDPLGYHLVNLLLHIVNALLLVRLLGVLRVRVALIWGIAFLFALHPVQVESVSWITERKNVLSTCFYFLAALSYLRFDGQRAESTGRRGGTTRRKDTPFSWYLLSLTLFALALLSKSVTASLPVTIVLMLLLRRDRLSFGRVWLLIPMLLMGLAAGLHTGWIEQVNVGAIGSDWDHTILERALIASRAALFYPWKVLLPIELAFVYPRWTIDVTNPWHYVPLLTLVLTGALAVWLWWKRDLRWPLICLSFYGVTIFPALGFANVYPHRFSFVADHFQYLASVGTIGLVVGVLFVVVQRASRTALPRTRLSVFIIVLSTFLIPGGLLSFIQSRNYRNEETLYRATIARNPDAWLCQANLARVILDKAEDARRNDDSDRILELAREAQSHLELGLDVAPLQHTLWQKYAEATRLQGEYDAAIEAQQRAIDLIQKERTSLESDSRYRHQAAVRTATLGEYEALLGRLYEFAGRKDDAKEAYERAANLNPNLLPPLERLARLAIDRGDIDEAVRRYRALIERRPNWFPALLYLGGAARTDGYPQAARSYFARALDVATQERDGERWQQAAFQLAWLLATSTDDRVRDGPIAERLAVDLVEDTGQSSPYAFDVLAAAQAEQGRFEEAVHNAQQAALLCDAYGLDDEAVVIRRRIELYQSGRAHREE